MSAPLTLDIDESDCRDSTTCPGCGVWFSEIAWYRSPQNPIYTANYETYGCPTDGCSGRIKIHSSVEPSDLPQDTPPTPK